MPTYRNDSTHESKKILDYLDVTRYIDPGNSVKSFQDVSNDPDWTETNEYPANQKTITSQNVFTDAVRVRKETRQLNLWIRGITNSTVTLQRRSVGGSTWEDVQRFTDEEQAYIQDAADDTDYRVGIKTGDYGSDTVIVRLNK